MPPKKKSKTTETTTTKSPKELHFERLNAAIKRVGGLGQILVRGIERRYEEEEDSENEGECIAVFQTHTHSLNSTL